MAAGQTKQIAQRQSGVTLKDVAEAAGVSAMVASRAMRGVLTGRRSDAVARAKHIRQTATEMGYLPNAFARGMKAGRFNSLALLLGTVEYNSYLTGALFAGICAAVEARGMHLGVARLPDSSLTDSTFVPGILRELMSDGLLINYNTEVPEQLERLIVDHALPAVWINAKHHANCVHPDDFGAAQQATRELIARGHRRIAYVEVGVCMHYSSQDRREGYTTAMAEAGLRPDVWTFSEKSSCAENLRRNAEECATRLRQASPGPTAILAYNPEDAMAVYHAAVSRLGWSMPEKLSLVTFSDTAIHMLDHDIAAMMIPQHDIAHSAVGMLLELVDGNDMPEKTRGLPCRFVGGDTVSTPQETSDE